MFPFMSEGSIIGRWIGIIDLHGLGFSRHTFINSIGRQPTIRPARQIDQGHDILKQILPVPLLRILHRPTILLNPPAIHRFRLLRLE